MNYLGFKKFQEFSLDDFLIIFFSKNVEKNLL